MSDELTRDIIEQSGAVMREMLAFAYAELAAPRPQPRDELLLFVRAMAGSAGYPAACPDFKCRRSRTCHAEALCGDGLHCRASWTPGQRASMTAGVHGMLFLHALEERQRAKLREIFPAPDSEPAPKKPRKRAAKAVNN